MHEGGESSFNPDHVWFLDEMKVRAHALAGDLDNAKKILGVASETVPLASISGINMLLAVAKGHAHLGDWQDALNWADNTCQQACPRQACRHAAEASLLAAEAAQHLGKTHRVEQHVETLLPFLKKHQPKQPPVRQ